MLLASPKAAGLFHAAAIQSGGCPARTMRAAESFSAEFVEAVGCGSSADRKNCLLAKSAEELLSAVPTGFNIATESGNYGSVIDGVVLTAPPVETFQKGEHNRVPVIIGHNADETSRSVPPIPSEAEYLALLRRTFPTPGVAELVARMYPPSEYGSPRAAFVAVTSDTRFICPITRVVEALRNGQSQPVHRYHFQFVPENANALLRQLGTWHGLDVLYLFESFESIAGYRPGPADRGVANVFSHFWSSLAAGQDLAGSGWNPSNAADAYYLIASASLMQEGVRARQCEFWFNLLAQLPSAAASGPKLN
jgi:para-nitrobenzyl esterase